MINSLTVHVISCIKSNVNFEALEITGTACESLIQSGQAQQTMKAADVKGWRAEAMLQNLMGSFVPLGRNLHADFAHRPSHFSTDCRSRV
jgi:hypothetical protein